MILSQYQKEFDNGQQKDIALKNALADNGLEYSNFSQSRLGNSFMRNEASMGGKNNSAWFQKFNLATAQRNQMENVFHKNALHNMDSEPIIEETVIRMAASGKGMMMEEEKLESQLKRSPFKNLCNSTHKSSAPQSGQKRSPHKEMSIEAPLESDQKAQARRNVADSDEDENFPSQNGAKISQWNVSPSDGKLKQNKVPSNNNNPNQVEIQEPGSVELIIQPFESVQTNNFYCLNENGGRIGRHSNNEIVILEESVSRHHSKIEFQNNKFHLVDIGSTTGTFIKIQANLVLEENMILELGSNQFLVEEIILMSEMEGELSLRVVEGMHFNQKFCIRNSASIGRKGNNTPTCIPFNDDFHLSNSHAKIDYVEGRFIFEDIGSTNGYV